MVWFVLRVSLRLLPQICNEDNKKKIPWVAWKTLCRQKELGGLGFRDIGRFNQALLGKQAWRIWDQPNSLLAQILKHRYFKNKSFLDSGKGTRPSYAWRSIKFGLELLNKGLSKRIGNGFNTKVWTENWLVEDIPRPPHRSSRFQGPEEDDLVVADLWDHNFRCWNTQLLRYYFEETDVQLILKLKLNPSRQDEYTWSFTNNGCYSTQSGYKLSEHIIEATDYGNQNILRIERNVWSRIWKMKTLPKVKHFCWKVVKGALAVADRLRTRNINVELQCSSCNSGPETINHALFTCPLATQVWQEAKLPFPRSGFSNSSVFVNFHHMLACLDKTLIAEEIRRAFPWVLWNIWKARNTFTFEKTRISTESVVKIAREEADDWFAANSPSQRYTDTMLHEDIQSTVWKPPPALLSKCNIGSSWINGSLNCGVSWLLRDSRGKPLFHSRRSYSKVRSQIEAEMLSLLWAVENLKNLRQTRVIFEISSYQAVEAFEFPDRHPELMEITEGLHYLLSEFEDWIVVVAAETCNIPATRIARSVTEELRYQSYIAQGGPSWLLPLLRAERIPVEDDGI